MKIKKIIFTILFVILSFIVITSLNTVRAENEPEIPAKYDLRDYIDIKIKNQGLNGTCVAVSKSTVLETYFKIKKLTGEINTEYDKLEFSMVAQDKIIQIDEANEVIKNFYKGNDKNIENEDDLLKFIDENENKDLRLEMEKIVPKYQLIGLYDTPDRWYTFKSILKEKSTDNIIYKNSSGEEISLDEVTEIRNEYKQYIMKNGAIRTMTNTQKFQKSELDNKVTICNDCEREIIPSHSIVIIGWDDNFSRLNFPESNRPINDGAYIAQNSWGETWGENGVFYISYEDINVENAPDGILSISKSDFEKNDTNAPKVDVEEDNDNVILRVSDQNGVGLDYFKYMYVDLAVNPDITDDGWITVQDSNKLVLNKEDEKNLWVYAADKNGNAVKSINGNIVDKHSYNPNYSIIYSQKEDGVGVLEVKSINVSSINEIKLRCTTISNDEFEENCCIDGNVYKYSIQKIGTHVINIYEVVDGKNVLVGFKTVTVDEIAECNKDIGPVLKKFEIVGINGLEDRAKIILEIENEPYKIKSVNIVNADTDLDVIIENPVDGKVEYEITENGKYLIFITNSIGNSIFEKQIIEDISKCHLNDKTKPEVVNVEVHEEENINDKVKVIIEARDLESGMKNIGLEFKGKLLNKNPVDNKAEFEVTEDGMYYIIIENKAGLKSIKELYISPDLFIEKEEKEDENEEFSYKIIEGENQTYNNSNLKVRLDAPAEKLISVYVNNVKLNENNYIVETGSTIITLKNEYLSTLEPGKYIIVANYENGKSIDTSFVIPEIEEKKDNNSSEKEKDENNVVPSEEKKDDSSVNKEKNEDKDISVPSNEKKEMDEKKNTEQNIDEQKNISEDNTVSNKKLPQTGVFATSTIIILVLISIFACTIYKKYNNIVIK